MNFLSLMGLDEKSLDNSDKAKATFLSLISKIKPMMEKRGIKSIVIFTKDNGELDLEMLDYNIKNRESEMKDLISKLNNKLLTK